jgi:hypothetical protein
MQRPAHVENPVSNIDVFPTQSADFANAQSGTEADEDPQIEERKIMFDMGHQKPLVVQRQNLYLSPLAFHRKNGPDLPGRQESFSASKGKHHFYDHQHVLDGLLA